MKVVHVCSQLQLLFLLLFVASVGVCRAAALTLDFPSSQSAYTYLFDSHLSLSPLTALYIMSNLVFPQQEVVGGVSLTDFHL